MPAHYPLKTAKNHVLAVQPFDDRYPHLSRSRKQLSFPAEYCVVWFRGMAQSEKPATLHYKRSRFVTQLPVDCLYSPAHAWAAAQGENAWRVGLTKFAARMLGEMVDHGFEVQPGAKVSSGQIVGWVEGFKAISDLFCVVEGEFLGGNPLLKEKISLVNKDCYGEGWLYSVRGQPDERCMDVQTYVKLLDKTIDKILEKQKGDDIE